MIRTLLVCCSLLLSHSAVSAALPTPAQRALDAIEAGARESHSDAVLVMRGGEVLLERYSTPTPRPIELMSVAKSIVALAIGALLMDGKLESLDTPVHRFFPQWKQGRKQAITIRMLMDHSSGLQNLPSAFEEIYPAPDVVQLALAAELSHAPGEHFSYNNQAVNLLAGVVEQAAGKPLDVYVKERLLQPLGIEPGPWFKDRAGNPHAMAGLALEARDAAALGRLVLDRGRAGGRQLIGAAYIDEMLAASKLSAQAGLLWWRSVAWVRFHADADSFRILERAGLDAALLQKLRPLEGRKFATPAELYAALEQAWGKQWLEQHWHPQLIARHGIGPWKPFHPEEGPEAYEANGWRGQSIVVIPKADLVAVRQIESRADHPPADDYSDFGARVKALADALVHAPLPETVATHAESP